MTDPDKKLPYIEVRTKRVKDIRPQDVIRPGTRWVLVYDVWSDETWDGTWDDNVTALLGPEPKDWDERDVWIRIATDDERREPGTYGDAVRRYRNPYELVAVQVEVAA